MLALDPARSASQIDCEGMGAGVRVRLVTACALLLVGRILADESSALMSLCMSEEAELPVALFDSDTVLTILRRLLDQRCSMDIQRRLGCR